MSGGDLVDGVVACADALVALLHDPERRRTLGAVGRERVRELFLMPRLVLNDLRLMSSLLAGQPLQRPVGWDMRRDPVCGMVLEGAPVFEGADAGGGAAFCSERCRAVYARNPTAYRRRSAD